MAGASAEPAQSVTPTLTPPSRPMPVAARVAPLMVLGIAILIASWLSYSRRAESDARPRTAAVNINIASAAELELLPRVGPTLAARIIAHRERHGPFLTLADLDGVEGIGAETLRRLGPFVRFE